MGLLDVFKRKEWRVDKKRNKIHRTALIHPNVTLGSYNLIGPYCVIGYAAEWKGHEQDGKVYIGSNNTFTGHVTIDSGTENVTTVRSNCYLMKGSHIGHDARIGKNATLSPGAKVGGFAFVGFGSNMGMNSTIHQKCTLPSSSILGMNSCVTKTTPTTHGKKYAGVPARIIGENITK